MLNYTPTTLTKEETELAVKLVTGRKGEYSAARVVTLLAKKPLTPTVVVNTTCSIGNISHTAINHINPHIMAKMGLCVACTHPPEPIKNKLGQPSGQFLWSIYRITEAANDDQAEGEEL